MKKLIKPIIILITTIIITTLVYTTYNKIQRNNLIEEYQNNGSTLQGVIIAYNLQEENKYLDALAKLNQIALSNSYKAISYMEEYSANNFIDNEIAFNEYMDSIRVQEIQEQLKEEYTTHNINLLVSNQPKHLQKEIKHWLNYAINFDIEKLNSNICYVQENISPIIEDRFEYALNQMGTNMQEFKSVMNQLLKGI